MKTWDACTRRPAPAPGMLAQLDRLRAALPGYDVTLTSHSGSYRFEAIRRADGPGPWCLISTDPADLWRELTPAPGPARTSGLAPPTFPDSGQHRHGSRPLWREGRAPLAKGPPSL